MNKVKKEKPIKVKKTKRGKKLKVESNNVIIRYDLNRILINYLIKTLINKKYIYLQNIFMLNKLIAL